MSVFDVLLDQTEIYCKSHTDSIVLLQKHGSNHRNATDTVGKIDLDFIIHPAAEIFRTKEDFKWGLFLSLSGQIYKWRQGSSIGVKTHWRPICWANNLYHNGNVWLFIEIFGCVLIIFFFFFSKSRSTCLYPSLFFLNYTNCKVLHIYSAGSWGISLSPESKMCQHDFWWLPIRRAQTLMTEVNKQGTDNRIKKSLNRFFIFISDKND